MRVKWGKKQQSATLSGLLLLLCEDSAHVKRPAVNPKSIPVWPNPHTISQTIVAWLELVGNITWLGNDVEGTRKHVFGTDENYVLAIGRLWLEWDAWLRTKCLDSNGTGMFSPEG